MNEKTDANRKAWDQLAGSHYRSYDIARLLDRTPLLDPLITGEVGSVEGKTLCHLLCHIGTDTLSWALLGAQVTGVDISPEAIKYARLLAEKMNIPAHFVQSDMMDVGTALTEQYDVVFASTGVLCWLPDIHRFAAGVSGLMKAGGFFYLYDGHPFRNLLLDEHGDRTGTLQGDYFHRAAWKFEEMSDYADPEFKYEGVSYEWDWTLGDVVSALGGAGLRIEFLHEFPAYIYSGYRAYDVEVGKVETYPVAFSIKAWKD